MDMRHVILSRQMTCLLDTYFLAMDLSVRDGWLVGLRDTLVCK